MRPAEIGGLGLLSIIATVLAVVSGVYIYEYYQKTNTVTLADGSGELTNNPDDVDETDITQYASTYDGNDADEVNSKMTGTAYTFLFGGGQSHRHFKDGKIIVPFSQRHRHYKLNPQTGKKIITKDWHSHRSLTDTELPGWSYPDEYVYLNT